MKKTYIQPEMEVVKEAKNLLPTILAGSEPISNGNITNPNEIASEEFDFEEEDE